MRRNTAAVLALLVTVLLLALPGAAGAAPSGTPEFRVPDPVVLHADPELKETRVPRVSAGFGPREDAPGRSLAQTGGTQVIVNYTGFTTSARNAFQYAVDIWAETVVSSVPIVVNASWAPLGANVLGQAWASFTVRNAPGLVPDRWYPIALANALSGVDHAPGSADINVQFSSNFPNWYFGTDQNPGSNFDFVSVVLHELGHGLGFSGSFTVNGSNGSWGGGSGFPMYYDTFVANGNGASATTIWNNYTNPSSALRAQLTSNSLYFKGTNARAANGGVSPKIYAPTTWAGGSSISHLDESSYPAGNPNSLMTPAISPGESIHDPGPAAKGILRDLGWTLNTGGGGQLIATQLDFTAQPNAATTGVPFATQPVVAVKTAAGQVVTTDNSTVVTLGLQGSGALTCTGGLSKTVTAGVATFAGCSIDTGQTNARLHASTSGLTGDQTPFFTVTTPPKVAAALTAPANFSTLGSGTVTFTRNAGSGVTTHYLWVGDAPGTANLFGMAMPASLNVGGLPADGRPLYVRLLSLFTDGTWGHNDYVFTAFATGKVPVAMISPPYGSSFSGSSATFTRTNGNQVAGAYIWFGNTQGVPDIAGYAYTTPVQTFGALPTDGRTVWVRLLTQFTDGSWATSDHQYTAFATGNVMPTILSPASGSTLGGSAVQFQRSGGQGIAACYFWAGTTPGTANLVGYTWSIPTTTFGGLPTNGQPVYVRLICQFTDNSWGWNDYVYTAS